MQYDDYVYWSRQRDPAKRREELDFWRRRLDPLPEELELLFENTAGDGAAHGRLVSRTLAATVREGIRGLANATGASPFTVFAFAFRLLLERYTPGRRVAFATPASTRSHPATAEMIGYFLNPLVISTVIDEEQTVSHALRRFGRELREILAHSSVPFQALAEELAPPRRRDRHPIFQAMFVYQETSPPPDLGSARLQPVALDLGESKFDLTLFVTEGESSLEMALEYRIDRFAEVWMRNLLGHYETLLEHLPGDLERSTADVPMLGIEEERRLVADAQGPGLKATDATLAPEQILDQVSRSRGSPAVKCGGVRRSYGELETSASSIALRLLSNGLKDGDRVGLFLDRSPLMIAGILGSHWAGAAYVPLDPGYPQGRNRDILADAEVAAVVTTSSLRGRLPSGPWSVIDADNPGGAGRKGDFPALSPDTPAYILYTSGSSGSPKGVVVTHGNLRASTQARLETYDFSPGRFLLLPSVAFDSSVAGIFWTLATAGTLMIPTEDEVRDPRRLARLVAEEGVTSLLCVPSLYAQLLEAGANRLQGLEAAIVAGESCSSRLVQEHFRLLPQVRLFNEYGPTEATVWASVQEVTEKDAVRPVSIGRPIPGVRIDVLDSLGRGVPAGIPGHAWISGPTVTRGYWRRPELTAERFTDHPGTRERRYRTGDRMAWTEDGRLLFLGREDEQIKLRGFRIEPGEIEAALLDLPGVERAAVVARSLGLGEAMATDTASMQLVAFLQGSGIVARWREDLAARLPDYMIPSRVVELPQLPLLPNGKIDRRRLRDMALDPELHSEEPGSIPGTREQALISLWEGLLGRSGIGLNDNFFELGGHSLLVVEMTRAIERDLEVTLTAADVFESPTVDGLARRIEQRGGPETVPYQHLFPIQPGGRKRPFIVALPHFFTAMLAARFRGERPVYGLRGVGLRVEGNLGRWRTMKDLGEELVEEIQRRFPDESLILAGYSFGASMAFEAARLMEEHGVPVHRLYLIAPMPLEFYRFGPFRLQLDSLRQPVEELSATEALRLYARGNNPLTRRPYRRAWRRLAVEPWRRLLCLVGRLRRRAGLPLTERILWADVRVDRFRLHARYRPGIVHTPTVFFNAMEPMTDAAATWRPYFRGPFIVHETPDPHRDEASVEAARQVILRHLRDLGDS
jgi:amino acid adenylation domain-containing protein